MITSAIWRSITHLISGKTGRRNSLLNCILEFHHSIIRCPIRPEPAAAPSLILLLFLFIVNLLKVGVYFSFVSFTFLRMRMKDVFELTIEKEKQRWVRSVLSIKKAQLWFFP